MDIFQYLAKITKIGGMPVIVFGNSFGVIE